MPNPNNYKDQNSFMDDCMHQVQTVEGKPHDQSVGQCIGMWKSKGKKKKKCASDVLRELSNKIAKL